MVGPHKIIFISPAKWITSQTYHVKIKPLIVRLWHIPRRIISSSPAKDSNFFSQQINASLVILFHKMTCPLKVTRNPCHVNSKHLNGRILKLGGVLIGHVQFITSEPTETRFPLCTVISSSSPLNDTTLNSVVSKWSCPVYHLWTNRIPNFIL